MKSAIHLAVLLAVLALAAGGATSDVPAGKLNAENSKSLNPHAKIPTMAEMLESMSPSVNKMHKIQKRYPNMMNSSPRMNSSPMMMMQSYPMMMLMMMIMPIVAVGGLFLFILVVMYFTQTAKK